MSIKFIITAAEAISSTDNSKNFNLPGVSMIVRTFTGRSKSLPHPQSTAGFFGGCVNDNLASKGRWRDPFLAGARNYCLIELSHARVSL